MQDKSNKIWLEWLEKADEDELNIQSILKHKDGTPNLVCFLAQQMAEKCLKSLLVFYSHDYPKTHDLKRIATLIEPSAPGIFDLDQEFTKLNKCYIITRYPGEIPEFSWQDAEENYQAAREIKEFVLEKIKR
ncbi:MAG: HEPN domain-containing protein [Candidatus Berkelbacteria bacterium Licking1014_96]|uniref:HEPN domain-containing protein n=1 Tax=Candidatus Berkelbacteria bacterium Licking1014_96 TaxID=2017149 RepID=A0A554LCW0_9BACT|nr:MAG: HEPN domain-containing protein [Candidatus Berkelbacteria bacterium Licking1014_96]